MQDKNFESLRSLSDCGRIFPYGVRVGKTAYGLGVFAYAFIPKGTPIARVPGKIVIDPEYGSEYCINAGDDKVLEPAPPFCYLNHACEPNCLLTQYVRDGDVLEGEELEEGNLEADDLEPDESDEFDDLSELGELCSDDYDDECFFGDGGATEIKLEDNEYDEDEYDNVDEFNVFNKVYKAGEINKELVNKIVEKIKKINISKFSKNRSSRISDAENHNANIAEKETKVKENETANTAAGTIENEPEFDDDADSEIWVETLRDIFPGEQLTIDYAWPAEKAIKCQCGCKKCRGWIVAANELKALKKLIKQK
ncbi:MAG: hypothetical protein LBP59_11750 [Planctomycetaceae bacterium]|nr:hypothetical protein [Planctomycetaceae bacterium]